MPRSRVWFAISAVVAVLGRTMTGSAQESVAGGEAQPPEEPGAEGEPEQDPSSLAPPPADGVDPSEALSDDETAFLDGLSLTDLLRLETSIGGIGSRPLREQAGVISVVTRQEIAESSARDLEEILVMQVPGFSSGADVTGVTGLGLRGLFAYLGQIVVFIDGLEMTDARFGVFPTGGHIPAEQIERIEIIRGPGSVSYGGNAEVAVIKVTTLGADLEGVAANTTLGSSGNGTFSHRYGAVAGTRFGADGHVRLSGSFGRNY